MPKAPNASHGRAMEAAAVVILCTAPAAGDVAVTLARGLVEGRLAACVNLIPGVRSLYTWKDELADDEEVQLVIKTQGSLYPAVEAWLREHHPYEEPEILALPVTLGSPGYLAWLLSLIHI